MYIATASAIAITTVIAIRLIETERPTVGSGGDRLIGLGVEPLGCWIVVLVVRGNAIPGGVVGLVVRDSVGPGFGGFVALPGREVVGAGIVELVWRGAGGTLCGRLGATGGVDISRLAARGWSETEASVETGPLCIVLFGDRGDIVAADLVSWVAMTAGAAT